MNIADFLARYKPPETPQYKVGDLVSLKGFEFPMTVVSANAMSVCMERDGFYFCFVPACLERYA